MMPEGCIVGTEIIIIPTVSGVSQTCFFFRSVASPRCIGKIFFVNKTEERKRKKQEETWGGGGRSEKMRYNENGRTVGTMCRAREIEMTVIVIGFSLGVFSCVQAWQNVSTNVSCCLRPFQLNGSTKRYTHFSQNLSALVCLVLLILATPCLRFRCTRENTVFHLRFQTNPRNYTLSRTFCKMSSEKTSYVNAYYP